MPGVLQQDVFVQVLLFTSAIMYPPVSADACDPSCVMGDIEEAQISEDFIVEWHRLLSNARRAKYGAMKNTSDSLQALSDTESLIRMYQAIG